MRTCQIEQSAAWGIVRSFHYVSFETVDTVLPLEVLSEWTRISTSFVFGQVLYLGNS